MYPTPPSFVKFALLLASDISALSVFMPSREVLCIKRRFGYLLCLLPCFVLWLTAAASPVNSEFRYIFGLYISLPLLVPVSFFVSPKENRL